MNILLTNYCNGKCPYCFASGAMNPKSGQKQFSKDNYKKILDFLKKDSMVKYLSILGGEPTLHTELETIIKMSVDGGFNKIVIFSNGIFSPQKGDLFKKYSKEIRFVWNVNPPDLYPAQIREMINRNINEYSYNSSRLGFNIYKNDYDPSFIFDIIRISPKVTSLRIGIAHPSAYPKPGTDIPTIRIDDYPKIGRIIFSFVRSIKENYPQITNINLDCGYTPCLFTPEENEFLKTCGIFEFTPRGCFGAIDIFQDLTIRSCFSTSGNDEKNKIGDFNYPTDVRDYSISRMLFSQNYLPLASEICESCPFQNNCFGGCRGERIIRANSIIDKKKGELSGKNISGQDRLRLMVDIYKLYAASYNHSGVEQSYTEIKKALLDTHINSENYNIKQEFMKFRMMYLRILDPKSYVSNKSKASNNLRNSKIKFIGCGRERHLGDYVSFFEEFLRYYRYKPGSSNHHIQTEIDHFLGLLQEKAWSISNPKLTLKYANVLTILGGKKESEKFLKNYLEVNHSYRQLRDLLSK